MSTPTEVRRLGRLLARRLEETGLPRDDGVSVEDLQRRLLPYHLCRAELGLTTKAEYDLLILGLLAEPGLVRTDEPLLATAVRKEQASPEPGLAFLKRFAASRLQLLDRLIEDASAALPDPARRQSEPGAHAPGASARSASRPGRSRAGASSRPRAVQPASAGPDQSRRATGRPPARGVGGERRPSARCWSCDTRLPHRRGLRYCPHCGVDQTVRACRACDAEMDREWAFCPICGERAALER